MKKFLTPFLILALVACSTPIKKETTKPIRFTSESYLRTRIAGNLVPDSTGITLLFSELNYIVKDTFSVRTNFNVDIELTGNTKDTTTLKHDLRFWVSKDTASLVVINITHDDFKKTLRYGRGVKLDSNIYYTENEIRTFKSGLQRYNVEVNMKNYKKVRLNSRLPRGK